MADGWSSSAPKELVQFPERRSQILILKSSFSRTTGVEIIGSNTKLQ